ncbi:MAG: GNAT family N-acetyltransferase [Defluviitaleaceae bacterium]|nr:GNAT family N-acetyltransferase [Defluviitaleaceae bacterium]
MEIRRLRPEEHVQFQGICQTVFFDIERDDIREFQKEPLEHAEKDNNVRLGVFDVNGKLQSALQILPFTMRMNGHDVPMGGIGAVVTRPESRGLGHMNMLIESAFKIMHENNQIFSFIYPFSFAYYRKFGYEMCYAYDKVRIPISQLQSYKCKVTAEPFEPGDSIQPYAKIYEHFTRERNLSIVRNNDDWEKLLARDPYKNLEFTFIIRDNSNQAVSYILYSAERDDDNGNRLIINECCWTTPEALHMVFGFLSKLGAEFEYVHWNAPADMDIFTLFPEGFDLEWQRESTGMNRVIDVSAALATLQAPPDKGCVTLHITDNFLQKNNGTYTVSWNNNALSVKKLTQPSPADIETTIETLAQLISGYITPDAAILKKDTTIRSGLLTLNALFPKRHLFITERY